MAENNINWNDYAGWDLPVFLNRLNPIPLDKTSLFYTLAAAESYAQNVNLAYIGQVITVVQGESVIVYKINADRTLTSLATSDNIEAKGEMVWAVQLEDESGKLYWSETDEEGNPVTPETPGAKQVLKLKVGDSISYVADLVDLENYLTKSQADATYVKITTLYDDDPENLGTFIIGGDDSE